MRTKSGRSALLLVAILALPTPCARGLPREDRVPGGIAIIPLADSTRPEAYLGGQRVLVAGGPGNWLAVAGIGLDVVPGQHTLQVTSRTETRAIEFQVLPREYAVQQVQIADQRKVDPLPSDLIRIDHETALMSEAKENWTEMDTPPLDLQLPLPGQISGGYGLRRVINGEPRSPHGGMDIVAPEGTPVQAAAPGRVTLVGDFFFNGRTVFIDHGQHLLTMYCHLERVDVGAGDVVNAGSSVGTVGRTGRASGPHLHWGVYLNGAAVNPELLLSSPAAPAPDPAVNGVTSP